MELPTELSAAVSGAAFGSIATAIVSFILHKKTVEHERRLAREKFDWDFLATTLPVLSRLFSSATPDRLKSEDDVFLMLDDVYASLREGAFRGIFTGTGPTEPISGNVRTYAEALTKYVRREMPREALETHRKKALDEVSGHWKTLLPAASAR